MQRQVDTNTEEVMHNEKKRRLARTARTLMLTATRFEEFRPEKWSQYQSVESV